jgi:hypothetical protein
MSGAARLFFPLTDLLFSDIRSGVLTNGCVGDDGVPLFYQGLTRGVCTGTGKNCRFCALMGIVLFLSRYCMACFSEAQAQARSEERAVLEGKKGLCA